MKVNVEILQKLKNYLKDGSSLNFISQHGQGICDGYKHALNYLEWLCKLYGVELL